VSRRRCDACDMPLAVCRELGGCQLDEAARAERVIDRADELREREYDRREEQGLDRWRELP